MLMVYISFAKYSTPSETMMKSVNFFQTIYLGVFVACTYVLWGGGSEWAGAAAVLASAAARRDVALFCCCASLGQLLIFALMKDFGSLVWITVSITRKLFTVLVSVFMFNHTVRAVQWAGVGAVFAGMALEVYMNYSGKNKKKADKEQKQE